MTEVGALASWLDTALAKVIAELAGARSMLSDATSVPLIVAVHVN